MKTLQPSQTTAPARLTRTQALAQLRDVLRTLKALERQVITLGKALQ